MVTKKDILELKKRMKKEDCTFTRLNGCYVNANREKVVTIDENFLNLDDEEFYKYLELAKKALSGTIGNNLLELHFEESQRESGGLQQFFMGLKQSGLKNPELTDRLYDQIIENYDYPGNYLILIFHDAYDVMTKTSDNLKIDESEEVFEYILCAICPVNLSKPGLGYISDENRIGSRIRDWVVGVPDTGFLFPAFAERSADIDSMTYFVKDAKDSHPDFVANVLGCGPRRTATEQKKVFSTIVKKALAPVMDEPEEVLLSIQEGINARLEEDDEMLADDEMAPVLTKETISQVLKEIDVEIPGSAMSQIACEFEEAFVDEMPPMEALIDQKALAAKEAVKEKQELVKQVIELQQELVDKELASDEESGGESVKTYDVVVRVKPDKATQIKSQYIGDQKFILIPMEDGENVNLNGVHTKI